MYFHIVAKRSSYIRSSISTHSEHRDQTIRQVVAYKRLTTMENYKQSAMKFGHACLQEVVIYARFQR